MARLGVFVGNNPSAVDNFERWLGAEVDSVHGYISLTDWTDFVSSAKWATTYVWSKIDRPTHWSIPLIVEGASLDAAARGDYNNYFRSVAQTLASYRPQDDKIHIRTGWEFNGYWFPWAAQGKEQAYIGAFRQFVDTFRSVSDKFVFEWNVNRDNGGMDPAKAYPGDAYVDVIGMDFYWNPQWDTADPNVGWDRILNEEIGLKWHKAFAAAHNKPMAYSEWGTTTNNAGPFIEKAKAWFESNNVVLQSYWDSNADYPGKLSDNSDPQSGAAYIKAFSEPSTTPAPTPAPAPTAGNTIQGTSGDDTLSGTSGDDTIYGYGGSDKINGKLGKDVLSGSSGYDVFVFDTKPGSSNIDKITDFNPYYDAVHLENAVFTQLGSAGRLASSKFWTGSSAHDADDRIIYNKATGAVLYDADGSGSGAAVQVATLSSNLNVTSADLYVT